VLGLKVGDSVTTETVLGFVGTSGNAKGTPPHLHFGVYTQSGAINPLSLFN
jgi:murein DD-endopeptidase MepM/ murein hydrolase activator NlpD